MLVLQSITGLFLDWGSGPESAFSPARKHVLELSLPHRSVAGSKTRSISQDLVWERKSSQLLLQNNGRSGTNKRKNTSAWTDFHVADLCCLIKSMGSVGKQHQFFLQLGFYQLQLPSSYLLRTNSLIKLCSIQSCSLVVYHLKWFSPVVLTP